MNGKIQQAGKELGVTDKDVKKLCVCSIKNKLICGVTGAAVAVVAFVAGLLVGGGNCEGCAPADACPPADCAPCPDVCDGYPYAVGLAIPVARAAGKRSSKIAILLVAALAMLIAIKAPAIFGQGIEYNVYRRQ